MKKILLLTIIALIPSLASATPSATGSITNFSIQALFSPIQPTAITANSIVAGSDGHVSQIDSATSTPYAISASASAGHGSFYSSSSNTTSLISPELYTTSTGNFGSNAITGITFNYVKNTFLYISADALIFGNSGLDETASSTASLTLSLRDAAPLSFYQTSGLTYNSFGDSYSFGQKLYLTYFSDQDGVIGLNAEVYANASMSDVSTPVPEPETYAMMLAGLGLMGFIAKRRKS